MKIGPSILGVLGLVSHEGVGRSLAFVSSKLRAVRRSAPAEDGGVTQINGNCACCALPGSCLPFSRVGRIQRWMQAFSSTLSYCIYGNLLS
jgi:hypothetical protein